MSQPTLIKPKIRLRDFDPSYCADLPGKEATKEKTVKLWERIGELQELLYANQAHSLVLLFQGVDASGKDGSVRQVLRKVNPAGVETTNFKAPSAEERAHDFLWRIHKAIPRRGNIGVFNRSHYEEVLIVRVMEMESKKVWEKRYEQINAFEKILAANNVLLIKFFLHISKDEQKKRLQDRLNDPQKNWKFDPADLDMRKRWDDFQEAYEDMLNRCSTREVPWHVIPANDHWYRNYHIAHAVVKKLEGLKMKWPKVKEDLSKIRIK